MNTILVPVRFAKWDDVLAIAAPDAKLKGLTFFWHYARGCAFAAKKQTQQAERGTRRDGTNLQGAATGKRIRHDAE